MVPTKLVKNWQAEYAKFFDTNNSKLNLPIYIGHKSITLDEIMRTNEEKNMITLRGIQPTTNSSKYLIIISLTSYKNNILYYISIYKKSFVTMLEKKRYKFCSKLTTQDVWGRIFCKKYDEEKRKETTGMSLYLLFIPRQKLGL